MNFEHYLKDIGLSQSTINEQVKNMERFITWTKENNYSEISSLRYTDLLGYVQHMKGRELSIQTQNIRIDSIRKYFEHLKEEGIVESNPARRLHIKGKIKTVIQNPLTYTELEQLYHIYSKPKEQYRIERDRRAHQRNTIILGLMIWQGIHSGELKKIETTHVKLDEGIIYIPGSRRSNGRELKLEARQIITLHQYIEQQFKKSPPRGDLEGHLFPINANNTITHIVNELQGVNPIIKNAQHIRASVILHWLRMYDKRTVQYMMGHKWISSTEHYEVQELEGLTDLLTKHHPFS